MSSWSSVRSGGAGAGHSGITLRVDEKANVRNVAELSVPATDHSGHAPQDLEDPVLEGAGAENVQDDDSSYAAVESYTWLEQGLEMGDDETPKQFALNNLLISNQPVSLQYLLRKTTIDTPIYLSAVRALRFYYSHGYTRQETVDQLLSVHKITTSEPALRRRHYRWGWRSHHKVSDEIILREMKDCIAKSLTPMSQDKMVIELREKKTLRITRAIVRRLLPFADPRGHKSRKRRRLARKQYTCKVYRLSIIIYCSLNDQGPGDRRHVDGNDKIKYVLGMPISLQIDGYSRRIHFINVVESNNCPYDAAERWLDVIEDTQLIPIQGVSDTGTENSIPAVIQMHLRKDHKDSFAGKKAWRYTTSPRNQKAESMNAQVSINGPLGPLIRFGAYLNEIGALDSYSMTHMVCFRLVFEDFIKAQFDGFKRRWNNHKFRNNKTSLLPTHNKTPNQIWDCPELFGGKQCGYKPDPTLLQEARARLAEWRAEALAKREQKRAEQLQAAQEDGKRRKITRAVYAEVENFAEIKSELETKFGTDRALATLGHGKEPFFHLVKTFCGWEGLGPEHDGIQDPTAPVSEADADAEIDEEDELFVAELMEESDEEDDEGEE